MATNRIPMIQSADLFKLTTIKEYNEKIFQTIGDEWMLFTAGTKEKFNTMTASWGTLGVFWHKPVAICFIRPGRHTFQFAEGSDMFTLSFFNPEDKHILSYCGAHSGRDVNKCHETGIKPVETPNGGITFDKARMFIECKKIYTDTIKPELILPDGIDEKIYPNKDYHTMFMGEILEIGRK